MGELATPGRRLPARHLSLRVPWNDTGWTGTVCCNPGQNTSCLVLPRIAKDRDDAYESLFAGKAWADLKEDQLPPCVRERGNFMSSDATILSNRHPYSFNSDTHKHMKETRTQISPYSAKAVPFNWMLREKAEAKADLFQIDLRPELEEQLDEEMGFKTVWMQLKRNQLAMLDTFFGAIQPERSLVFFYAKRTPFAEDARRVLIGVGRVLQVEPYDEYTYEGPGIESVIWDRGVRHSIRPGFEDGFLLPYHQVLEYLAQNPGEDPARFAVFVPDDHFWEFSYASEHVRADGALATLLEARRALETMAEVVEGNWRHVFAWIDARVAEIWAMRGPCPGLGSALCAFGFEHGVLLAHQLESHIASTEPDNNVDPWGWIERLLDGDPTLPTALRDHADSQLAKKWKAMGAERQNLLRLLSRFDITPDQAIRFYVKEEREAGGFTFSDSDILQNPYLLYEQDRTSVDPVPLSAVERGVFPDESIAAKHPLPGNANVSSPSDSRRVRAHVVDYLERRAAEGHTVQSRQQVIRQLRALDIKPSLPLDGDLMALVEQDFAPVIDIVPVGGDATGYQLGWLADMGEVIRTEVTRRRGGRRIEAEIDWSSKLLVALGDEAADPDDEEEEAQNEKVAALREIYSSRISVLIGQAGTGKTTLLKTLCAEPSVRDGGVLLLAPTGKARVRLEQQTRIRGAMTVAQFLLKYDRYDFETGSHFIGSEKRCKDYKTVVIDEASMLTEDQLAAVIDAVVGVQRIILVGDPQQLPPIGAGRPFLDICRLLRPDTLGFPRVAPGYAELTINRRQRGQREDMLLADWFRGTGLDPGADIVWQRLAAGETHDKLRLIEWQHADEVPALIRQTIAEELRLEGVEDEKGFDLSLGGNEFKNHVYFHPRRKDGDEPGAGEAAEAWQILAPSNLGEAGTRSLNRMIQSTFRAKRREFALKDTRYRKIPRPLGAEGIIYGDKVINVENHRRYNVWPKDDDALRYIANGEIGIVVGEFKGPRLKRNPKNLEVEFGPAHGAHRRRGRGRQADRLHLPRGLGADLGRDRRGPRARAGGRPADCGK